MPACSVVITVMWGCHLCLNVRGFFYLAEHLHLMNKVFKGKYFSLAAESKPHGLALQEDIWDADVDLHQKLLRRWKELKEHTGHKYACRHMVLHC